MCLLGGHPGHARWPLGVQCSQRRLRHIGSQVEFETSKGPPNVKLQTDSRQRSLHHNVASNNGSGDLIEY